MDIKKLQIFAYVADTESISKTAQLTDYSQSGISHMIKSLESDLGLSLIIRDRYGVHLTAAGRDLLPYVNALIRENEKFEQYLNELHGFEKGTLTIGTFTSVAIHWLPPILSGFQGLHPGIDIRLKEGGMQELERWIMSQDVDLAFYSRCPEHSFQFIHIQKDPIVAVLPEDYPVREGVSSFPIEDFNGKPFIMPEMGVDYDVHRLLKSAGVSPQVRFSAKDDHAIMSMVEHHLGISILPQLITKNQNLKIKTMKLNPEAHRDLGIGLYDSRTLSPIARQFVTYVKKYFNI